jgi:hypothetical protein
MPSKKLAESPKTGKGSPASAENTFVRSHYPFNRTQLNELETISRLWEGSVPFLLSHSWERASASAALVCEYDADIPRSPVTLEVAK